LSTRFFPNHQVRHGAHPSRPGAAVVEQQQAALLEVLRRAAGRTVTYGELRDAGIEFPASVVAELELAGLAIERCRSDRPGGQPLVGVRLDPRAPGIPPAPGDGQRSTLAVEPAVEHQRPAARPAPHWPRALAAGALLASFALVGALAALGLTGGGGHGPRVVTRARGSSSTHVAPAHTGSHPVPSARTVSGQTASVSPAHANQLEARGHELLEAGGYGGAVQVLTAALGATGERLADCIEPVSETCLTYAYALYDLGRALQLGGHPAEAVSVLQRRLQIDNQRPAVQSELALARAQAR
jgi:hypothetical protein